MAKLAKGKQQSSAKSDADAAKKSANNRRKVADLDSDEIENQEEMESSSEEDVEGVSQNNNKNHETKSTLLKECQKLFGTNDLYKIFELEKASARKNDVKKAYYKMSLKHHPDKVSGGHDAKKESTEKFQVLSRIYAILGDEEKKQLYDETGTIDGEDDENLFSSDIKDWEQYWRQMFKKISKEDIDGFFKTYKNSDEERSDLLALYEKHSGDMDLILEEVFSEYVLEDEERFRQIIHEAIERGDAKKHAKFVNESKRKASKRKAHYEQEAKEAEEMRKELGIDESQDSLRKAILSRRQAENDNFLNHLAEKYGGSENGKAKKESKKAAGNKKKQEKQSDKEMEPEELEEEEVSEADEDEPVRKKRQIATKKPASAPKRKTGKRVKRL